MKKIYFFIWMLAACQLSYAQSVSVDTAGRVSDIRLARGASATFKIKSDLSVRVQQDALRRMFIQKLTQTLANMKDGGKGFGKYYSSMWFDTKDRSLEVRGDLQKILAWLQDPAKQPGALQQLKPFYAELATLLKPYREDEWFLLNGAALSSRIQLSPASPNAPLNLEIQTSGKFNAFMVNLFNATYPLAGNKLPGMTESDFNGTVTADLKKLVTEARSNQKKLADLTPVETAAFVALAGNMQANDIILSIRNGAYFKNWVWLREGEPTINPFELKAKDRKDTANVGFAPRTANVSMLDAVTANREVLNKVVLARKGQKDWRNIHFYRTADGDTRDIAEAVRGDEQVRVNMHNTLLEEQLALRRIKDTVHSGKNDIIEGLGEGVTLLAATYKSLMPGANWFTTFVGTLAIPKSLTFDWAPYPYTDQWLNRNAAAPKKTIDDQLRKELQEQGRFNAYAFEVASDPQSPDINPKLDAGGLHAPGARAYAEAVLNKYADLFNEIKEAYDSFVTDSIILETTYAVAYTSNLPPPSVTLHNNAAPPLYRTEALATEKVDRDVTTTYRVMSLVKSGAKTDSSIAAEFRIKTANLKRIAVSAGALYTFARPGYGINTFSANETSGAQIDTKQKTISYVAALHVYPVKINMLDNKAFSSAACPAYARLSVFLGFDIPDITKHFYPGISYDVIPGIKLSGGWHVYMHTKYELKNNVAVKSGDVPQVAGGFAGIHIDPSVVVKAIQGFTK